MNKAHFKKVLDQITAHPETWKQSSWHCGTQHCFAGWAQLLSGQPADENTVRRDARIYLDLSSDEATWLFEPETTIDNFTQFLNNQAGYNRAGYDRAGYDRDGLDKNNHPRG